MIEYLYDAIRATAGEDITIAASITDETGEAFTGECHLMLFDDLALIDTVKGLTFDNKTWDFHIPADTTRGRLGRYWYCICAEDVALCFKQPIYLISTKVINIFIKN